MHILAGQGILVGLGILAGQGILGILAGQQGGILQVFQGDILVVGIQDPDLEEYILEG